MTLSRCSPCERRAWIARRRPSVGTFGERVLPGGSTGRGASAGTLMRFVTYLGSGFARVGLLDDEHVFPLAGTSSLTERLASGGPDRLRDDGSRARTQARSQPLSTVHLLAPLQPPTIRDFTTFERHVEGMAMFEGGSGVPAGFYDSPRFYFSNPYAVAGPDEDVPVPPGCERFDYELEVAAVIGAAGRDLDANGARVAIFAYTLFNDWSARDIGRREIMGKLGPAKAKDTTNTLGPVLVTADELAVYRNAEGFLDLELKVELNGTVMGQDTLANASWTMEELVVFASRGTWVRPGDVIGSGTCGSGCLAERWAREGSAAPRALLPGDEVSLTATGIGELRNHIVIGVAPRDVPTGRQRIPQ